MEPSDFKELVLTAEFKELGLTFKASRAGTQSTRTGRALTAARREESTKRPNGGANGPVSDMVCVYWISAGIIFYNCLKR